MPVFFLHLPSSYIFFFNDTATTEIYTLSLHDALPIYRLPRFPSDRFASPVSRVVPSASALPGRASPHRKTMSHFGHTTSSPRTWGRPKNFSVEQRGQRSTIREPLLSCMGKGRSYACRGESA